MNSKRLLTDRKTMFKNFWNLEKLKTLFAKILDTRIHFQQVGTCPLKSGYQRCQRTLQNWYVSESWKNIGITTQPKTGKSLKSSKMTHRILFVKLIKKTESFIRLEGLPEPTKHSDRFGTEGMYLKRFEKTWTCFFPSFRYKQMYNGSYLYISIKQMYRLFLHF